MNYAIKGNVKTLEDWFEKYPPAKRLKHWKDGRSAKETAKEYVNNNGKSLKNFCKVNGISGNFILEGELKTDFDLFDGSRNHDVCLHSNHTLMTIEVKADEEFDLYITKKLSDGVKKLNKGENTKIINRVTRLVNELLDMDKKELDFSKIRYQLLTAVAGTLVEANKRGINTAYFLVQTIASDSLNPKKLKRNEDDLNYFMGMLPGSPTFNKNGLSDKVIIKSEVFNKGFIDFYIGKI